MQSIFEGAQPTSPRLSRLPLLIALLAALTVVVGFLFGRASVPFLPAFFPAVTAVVALLYFLAAFHFSRLYILTGRLRLASLSFTFALSGLLIVFYFFAFPSNSSFWLWIFWHLTLAFGLGLSLLVPNQERLVTLVAERSRSRFFFLLLALLSALAALLALFTFLIPLPILAIHDNYTASQPYLEVTLILPLALLTIFAFSRFRSATLLDRWLIVCILLTLADAQTTLSALERYHLGWYLARLLTMTGALVLLFALLGDFARIYSNLALSHAALALSAQTDPLTQVASREHALARISSLLASSTPFALGILDLDHFKSVNDLHGHLAGDDALVAATSRVAHALKAQDLVGRLSGEEFVLVFPNSSLPQAMSGANRVLASLRTSPITTRAGNISLTASIGLVSAIPTESLGSLLSRADAALYAAKAAGRGRLILA